MEVSFVNLAAVLGIAFAVPLVAARFPRLPVPAVVLEVVAGIVVGPAVLAWVEVDDVVGVVARVGLAFLLFLAGLELDLRALAGPTLHRSAVGFAWSVAAAGACGLVLSAAGLVDDPVLAGVILIATSLGLVVGVLKETGHIATPLGQLTIAGASLGDVTAVVALSVLYSAHSAGIGSQLALLAGFTVLVTAIAVGIGTAGRVAWLGSALARLQDSTAEIRVRGAMVLVLAFVVLAEELGLEAILGAFVAGAVVGLVDRHPGCSHPLLRVKLDALGYGFLVPVFFVASGLGFDLDALLDEPAALALVPLLLATLLLARGVPALAYRPVVGRSGAVVAGLLQATSLPFIVVATEIGVQVDALDRATASAFVAAGLVSAIVFPAVAVATLRARSAPVPATTVP